MRDWLGHPQTNVAFHSSISWCQSTPEGQSKVMLIVPYSRTLCYSRMWASRSSHLSLRLWDTFPQCSVGRQLHLQLHMGLLLQDACCALTPNKILDPRPPRTHVAFNTSLIRFFSDCFCCRIHLTEVSLSNALQVGCTAAGAVGEPERMGYVKYVQCERTFQNLLGRNKRVLKEWPSNSPVLLNQHIYETKKREASLSAKKIFSVWPLALEGHLVCIKMKCVEQYTENLWF